MVPQPQEHADGRRELSAFDFRELALGDTEKRRKVVLALVSAELSDPPADGLEIRFDCALSRHEIPVDIRPICRLEYAIEHIPSGI